MITNFKLYEKHKQLWEIQEGTFIVLNLLIPNNDVNYYINNTIGIWSLDREFDYRTGIAEYSDVPKNILTWFNENRRIWHNTIQHDKLYITRITADEILLYSDNKKELELLLIANKYNL